MGSGERGEVDRCNRVEEFPGMEDSQQVAGNEATH